MTVVILVSTRRYLENFSQNLDVPSTFNGVRKSNFNRLLVLDLVRFIRRLIPFDWNRLGENKNWYTLIFLFFYSTCIMKRSAWSFQMVFEWKHTKWNICWEDRCFWCRWNWRALSVLCYCRRRNARWDFSRGDRSLFLFIWILTSLEFQGLPTRRKWSNF